MLGGVVFSTLRTFLADNAGIGLPLGIERVIWIGSKCLQPSDCRLGAVNVMWKNVAIEKNGGIQ